jgi:hypothetical protein
MAKDPHAQAQNIYHEILDRLEELVAVYADMTSDDDEGDIAEQMEDVLDGVVQEASERGLDERTADRLFNAIAVFAQKSAEM